MKSVSFVSGALAAGTLFALPAQAEKKCYFVNSYHAGYEWSDAIEKGLQDTLKDKCKLETFYMDTKRNGDAAFKKKKGEEAKAWADAGKPDVVIIADDNAATEFMLPFYKDSKTPFVFCGLNWTIDKYGLPWKHSTGMIEVAPVQPMINEIKKNMKTLKTVAFVSVDNETERKDFDQESKIFKANGIELKPYYAKNFEEWKKNYIEAQKEDFVFLSNNAGINDWNNDAAITHVTTHSKKLSGAIYDWMAPYTAFVMAKSAYEHGEFAGQAAAQILGGKAPNAIQVTTNKKYDPILNPMMHDKAPMKLSSDFTSKAKPFRAPASVK